MKALIEAAVESVQPAMEAKRHTLRVQIPEVPVLLHADPVRLTQVISNLLTNAAKYTPVGGLITAGGRLDEAELTLFVRDNGLGLSPAAIPRIFDMYNQVESTGAGPEGGLGIGLALAKGLVQLHGGRIAAYSEGLGHGSEFVVSLPQSLIVEKPQSAPAAQNSRLNPSVAWRVLIADDNKDAAETLGIFLELSGHEVHIAHSGVQALELVNQLRPDVAVLDIGMPDFDGYEVAKRIRLEPWGAGVTLIALTGWGQVSDKQLAKAAGFDHHCTKPVDPEALESFFSSSNESRD